MSASNFIKLNKNNTATLNFDNYNGNSFIDATMVRNIVRFKILTRIEKKQIKRGSPDVMVMDILGKPQLITREKLVNEYRLLNGTKIKLHFLKAGRIYQAMSACNESYAAILLPDNFNAQLNNKIVNSGSYIIAPKNDDGTIDLSRLSSLDRKAFRKMFVVPQQDIIKAHSDNGSSNSNIFNMLNNRSARPNVNSGKRNGINLGKDDFNINTMNNDNVINIPENRKNNTVNNKKDRVGFTGSANKYSFRAIGRIVDENKNMLGYLIEDTKGNKKQLTTNVVMHMCNSHKISNLILVRSETGKFFLKGNGMRIESLPEYLP